MSLETLNLIGNFIYNYWELIFLIYFLIIYEILAIYYQDKYHKEIIKKNKIMKKLNETKKILNIALISGIKLIREKDNLETTLKK